MSEYKLVPVEPTDGMIAAYNKYHKESPYIEPYETSVTGYYKAMLSAAPTTNTVNIDRAEHEAMKADAERYRWLREQTWFSSSMCVVVYPKKVVKLGADCPSQDKLDQAIDQARKI